MLALTIKTFETHLENLVYVESFKWQTISLLFKLESFGSIPLCIDKIYVSV
jgi:hypothetical protein